MRPTFSHPFLWVILIVNGLTLGHIIWNIHVSLVTTLLYVAYATAWALLVSLAKDYLDNLDDREKMMNV